MSADPNQLRQVIENARAALRQGDNATALRLAEQAARLAPDTEEPWLILTAVSSEPRAALEFAKRALVINPNSERARKAVEWAKKRLPQDVGRNGIPSTTSVEPESRSSTPTYTTSASPLASLPRATSTSTPQVATAPKPQSPAPKKTNRRSLAYIALLAGFVCIAIAVAGWTAFRNPVVASLLSADSEAAATATLEGPHSAQFDVEMPTQTPTWTFTPSITPTATSTFTPLPTFTSTATLTPEFTFTPLPTDTPAPTETPGAMEAVVLADTATPVRPPTKAYVAPTKAASSSSSSSSGGTTSYGARWIDVNLSQQMVYAYEGDVVVNSFLASTGTWATPTVTGSYKIYVKYISTTMAGPGYNLPNVPYTMYFYKGYGIHGTYWHNNFGVPMSHGCVNLSIPDAEWLYYWASVGTVVNVHY